MILKHQKGSLSTDFVAKIHHYRRLQTRDPRNRLVLRPLVNHSVDSINPSESVIINITTRLDKIPSTSEITLNGGITANSNNNLIAQDQLSLPVISVLPNTGQTPLWRNIAVISFVLGGLIVFIILLFKPSMNLS